MTARLRKAFKFFLDNQSMYCSPPGRAACALSLAKAEIWADEQEYTFDVLPDLDPDTSWMDERVTQLYQDGELEIVGVVLLDNSSKCPLTSIWGVVYDDRSIRVVKAELANEYFDCKRAHLQLTQTSF